MTSLSGALVAVVQDICIGASESQRDWGTLLEGAALAHWGVFPAATEELQETGRAPETALWRREGSCLPTAHAATLRAQIPNREQQHQYSNPSNMVLPQENCWGGEAALPPPRRRPPFSPSLRCLEAVLHSCL